MCSRSLREDCSASNRSKRKSCGEAQDWHLQGSHCDRNLNMLTGTGGHPMRISRSAELEREEDVSPENLKSQRTRREAAETRRESNHKGHEVSRRKKQV